MLICSKIRQAFMFTKHFKKLVFLGFTWVLREFGILLLSKGQF